MWTVTLADLRMRARQFAIAVVGATLVFAMALVMAGLSGGFRAETRRTVAAVGADYFAVPAGGGGPFTSPSAVPAAVLPIARRTAGVTAADPLVVIPTVTIAGTPHGGVVHLIGTRPGGMGAPAPARGRPASGPEDALVDDAAHLHLGQRFLVGGHPFRVVGLLHGYSYFAGTPSVYVTLAAAQAVAFAGRDDITAIAIRGRPAHVPARVGLFTPAQARADMLRPVANGMRSIDVVTMLLWLVAAVIIGAIVYLSALERRPDFAVLKAVGSSARWLYGGLALQAAAVAAVSGLLAMAVEPLVAKAIPMNLAVPQRDLLLLVPVTVLIGLVASLSGLRQVVRADPALAFGSR